MDPFNMHFYLFIYLFIYNIIYIYNIYLQTFKNISLDSKDKICANIYLRAFPGGGAHPHLSSVQKYRFWGNKKTVEPLRRLEKWGGKTQPKFTAAGGHIWYFHILQPPFPRVLNVK